MYFNFCFCFFSWYSNRNTSSSIGWKICAITAAIYKYNKQIKKHDTTVFLAKSKLNSTEILISKALIHSVISIIHDKFVLMKYVLKEYKIIKGEIKKSRLNQV